MASMWILEDVLPIPDRDLLSRQLEDFEILVRSDSLELVRSDSPESMALSSYVRLLMEGVKWLSCLEKISRSNSGFDHAVQDLKEVALSKFLSVLDGSNTMGLDGELGEDDNRAKFAVDYISHLLMYAPFLSEDEKKLLKDAETAAKDLVPVT